MAIAENQMDTTPSQLVERLRSALAARDRHAFVDCFADDGVYELPQASAGGPARYEGIRAIRAALTAPTPLAHWRGIEYVDAAVRPGVDDGTITVEFTASGHDAASGEPFSFVSSVGVLRIRDGKVACYRDYPRARRSAPVGDLLDRTAATRVLGAVAGQGVPGVR